MKKKDTYYFTHDANAKDDPKMILLMDQLGLEGYGIFWVLIEVLRAEPNYKANLNILPGLAKRYQTSFEKIKTVINCFDLFEIENEIFFFNRSLQYRMLNWDKTKALLSEAGKKGNLKKYGLTSGSDRHPTATQSLIEKSKEKESEVVFIPPTEIEFIKFFTDSGYDRSLGLRAFKGYSVSNPPWHDTNGKPIRDWKQKCVFTWFKDTGEHNKSSKSQIISITNKN